MKNKFAALIFLISPILLFSEEWHVKKSKNNLVKFTSSTSLLDFNGTTDKIDGYIYWEGDNKFGKNNEVYFEVDLNSVETGIGKRDSDMREDVLETDKWPTTSFKGVINNVTIDKSDSSMYNVVSIGKMFIHGIEKELQLEARIKVEDDIMNVKADFSVFLKDYEIEAPSLLAFIKVAEEIKLHLDFQLEKYQESKN